MKQEQSTQRELTIDIKRRPCGALAIEGMIRDEVCWAIEGDFALHVAGEAQEMGFKIYRAKGYGQALRDGALIRCACAIETPAGSRIEIQDVYQPDKQSVCLQRSMQVTCVGEGDTGFYVDMSVLLPGAPTPMDCAWFAPGYWYGRGEPFFRLDDNNEAGDALDHFSAPVLVCYDERRHRAVSLMEASPGRCKTIVQDHSQAIPGMLISDQFYLPAMGVRKTEAGKTSLYHAYPGYTHVEGEGTLYRLLPMRQGVSRTVRMEIGVSRYEDFHQALRTTWRRAWQQLYALQYFASPDEVRQALLKYVDQSYTCSGDVHKYMKDAQYNEASSGFLFRNIDLAHLMLKAYAEQPCATWKAHAIAVIDSQICECRLYGQGKDWDLRASVEALNSLMKCFECAKQLCLDAQRWADFAIDQAQELLPRKDYYSIPLMLRLYRHTGDERYLKAANEKGTYNWETYFCKMHFMYGITDCRPQTIDRESAILALEGYLDLFETTGQHLWLERAGFCADFLETMQVIADIDMEPYGATGKECAHRLGHYVVMAGHGNHLSCAGLSHIGAGGACGDIYSVYSAPDFYRLYQHTGDTHCLDFARMLQYHTLQFVNMNNKTGGMNDPRHGVHLGFVNEFFAIGTSTGYVTGRGWAHGDNIGWCPYVILSAMQRMKCLTGAYALPYAP